MENLSCGSSSSPNGGVSFQHRKNKTRSHFLPAEPCQLVTGLKRQKGDDAKWGEWTKTGKGGHQEETPRRDPGASRRLQP